MLAINALWADGASFERNASNADGDRTQLQPTSTTTTTTATADARPGVLVHGSSERRATQPDLPLPR